MDNKGSPGRSGRPCVKRGINVLWFLVGLLSTMQAIGQSTPPRIPELPLPDEDTGQITLDAMEMWGIVEFRVRKPRGVACANPPRGSLPTSSVNYEAVLGRPREGKLGIGYINWKDDVRERCARAEGEVFNGVVRFDMSPLVRILERARVRRGDSTLALRFLSATVRAKRDSGPRRHNRCIVGRGAPLGQVNIYRSRPEGASDRAREIDGRPDARFVRYGHNDYINLDGIDVGYRDALWRDPQPTDRNQEAGHAGAATMFYSATDRTLSYLNQFVDSGETGFPEWASLLSVENIEFRSNRDCLAIYGNFRMNVTYEYVSQR